ncbi:hypothetical protein FDN13_02775 [Caloramator sp. E03]|uniref:hypothetical protein n=1 Tax=Caloramator sp. E03 TaxID=2576307 RepID=UPI00111029FD|nr:hypothetical protein [Caloramator sp. E03]QCX32714.1 hypothetical protein FDN13_02775 [Caloramator sp. E03]
MTKKASAVIYVIILLLPIMTFLLKIIDLTIINYKINSNIIFKQQSLYNAEAGIEFGIKKVKEFNPANPVNVTYYMIVKDNNVEFTDKKQDCECTCIIKITSTIKGNYVEYIIDSLGRHKSTEYEIKKVITEPVTK